MADVTMYAVPTQAKLSNALNCPVIVGSAVAMMEVSKLASMTANANAPRTTYRRLLVKPGTRESVAIAPPYPQCKAGRLVERDSWCAVVARIRSAHDFAVAPGNRGWPASMLVAW